MPDILRSDTALGIIGIGLFLLAWEMIGRSGIAGMTCPPLSQIIAYALDPARITLLSRALPATFGAMLIGYMIGAATGIGLAFVGYVLNPLRAGADLGATLLHSIPAIALAPIFVLGFGRETAPAALAAFNAFFVFYVAASSGLSDNSPIFRDLMKVYGASPIRRFLHVDFPAALPSIATGMKLAVPTSLIGAILGEWFGAPRGLGLLIVTAMQNFQILLLWSAVLLTAILSFGLFCLLSLVERAVYERFR